jgi:valyl-tRNA synthetase
LRLLHPFTPFVTEEIWGHLRTASQGLQQPIYPSHGAEWEKALIVARWPTPQPASHGEDKAIADFSLIMELVRSIRNLRAEKNVSPKLSLPATLVGGERTPVLQRQSATIASLARLDDKKLIIQEEMDDKPEGSVALVVGPVEIYIPLAEMVDPQEQRVRLEKELGETASQIQRLETLLAGPFAEKAPANVVDKERQKLADYKEKAEKINSQLETLE